MIKIRKHILLICLLFLLLTGCGKQEVPSPLPVSTPDSTAEPLIILTATPYSTPVVTPEPDVKQLQLSILEAKQKEDETEISSLLETLSAVDPEQGEKWQTIMDYWAEMEQPGFVHEKVLPDGLPNDDSLCIVVLGYKLKDDGSIQDELVGRLQVALASAKKYPNAYVLVTGGGTAANKKDVTEAGKMAEWLVKKGLKKNRILKETDSKTTVENVKYSYTLLSRDYSQIKSIAVITSDYHIRRGCLFFTVRFLEKKSPLKVVSNAVYVTGKDTSESADVLVSGVKRLSGLS